MKRLLFILCSGVLSVGCAAQQPAISDIRQDVVKVQGEPMLVNMFGLTHVKKKNEQTLQIVKAEAERGCQLYERKVSNLLSARCVQFTPGLFGPGPGMRNEYLFACTKD